jgi:hypothetical protein
MRILSGSFVRTPSHSNCTRLARDGRTEGTLLMVRDTVAVETPARLAIS